MAMKIINETTSDNDYYTKAQEIPDVLYHGDSIQIIGSFSSSGDKDWYDIFFSGLDTIASLALMPQGNFPVKLTIKDSQNTTRGTVEGNPGEMVRFKYPVDARRDSIKVCAEILSGTASGDYVLYCNSIEADDIDPLKDNDYAEDAQEINVGDHIICTVDEEGDYDYFKITFPKDGLVDFTVYPGHRYVDSKFKVLDAKDKQIDYTYVSSGIPRTLSVDVKANTVYYISLNDLSTRGKAVDHMCVLNVDYAGQGGGIEWPYNHFFTNMYTHEGETFRCIFTDASNIKSEIINSNISDCNYFGMSGGFFHADNGYSQPPTGGTSIHWNKGGTDNQNYNKKGKTGQEIIRSSGTLATYNEDGITKALISTVSSVDEIREKFGNIDLQTVVGGASLYLKLSDSEWENKVFSPGGELEGGSGESNLNPLMDARRAGIGFRILNNKWQIVMLISTEVNGCSLFSLRNAFKALGCYEAIFLDGSGSAQYRIKEFNGEITADPGNKGPLLEKRKIWNMVKLIDVN